MEGQKRFNWHAFLMISMVIIGVGFFLLSLILPRLLWRDENLGLDEPKKNQATDTVAKGTPNNSVSVPDDEEVAQLMANLESLDEEHDSVDERPQIPIDEDGELTAERESLVESSGSEHEPVDYTVQQAQEQKRKYNLYDHAPEGFEDYVQYDRSLGIDQLPSRWPEDAFL